MTPERLAEHIEGHPPCVKDGHHTCQEPSGRACIDCGAPAGTSWGPHWCPDCDSRRLARFSAQLDDLRKATVRFPPERHIHGSRVLIEDGNVKVRTHCGRPVHTSIESTGVLSVGVITCPDCTTRKDAP